jgi:hypothetical protein
MKEQLAKTAKLNAEMPPETEKNTYQRQKSAADRLKGQNLFVETAYDMGISDPTKIKKLWNYYNEAVPFYDNTNMKPIPENLKNSGKKFGEFINEWKDRKDFPAIDPVQKEVVVDGKTLVNVNGQWHEKY